MQWTSHSPLLLCSCLLDIQEVAVIWREVPGSKVCLKDALLCHPFCSLTCSLAHLLLQVSVLTSSIQMLRDLVLIRLCYLLKFWRVNGRDGLQKSILKSKQM